MESKEKTQFQESSGLARKKKVLALIPQVNEFGCFLNEFDSFIVHNILIALLPHSP